MLALCLMLSGTYYTQNYTSIIGWCLDTNIAFNVLLNLKKHAKYLVQFPFKVTINYVQNVHSTTDTI